MTDVARHIIFSGYVQGVGFRFTARQIARRYNLTGFVRNLPDGRVEMLVQGQPEDIKDCLQDLTGTFNIRETQVQDVPFDSRYDCFDIAF